MRKRQQQIEQFIDTNVIGTLEVLQAQPFFEGLSESATRDVMAGQVKRRRLVSEKLGIDARRYYARKKLPPERIAIEYAALKFCHETGLGRLARKEVARLFPEFPPQLVSWSHPYLLHHDGELTRLVQIRVERSGRPQNIIQKHTKAFRQKRKAHPGFDELIKQDRFSLVIIHGDHDLLFGAFPNDPNSLEGLISAQRVYPKRVHLHHEPELLHFPSSSPRKEVRDA